MNNGSEILRLQNLSENIRLLAAQRQMYSTAKRWNVANAVVSLVAPIVATALQILFGFSAWVVIFIDLILMVAESRITQHCEDLIEWGAGTQQVFDSNVFGMEFENRFGDERTIDRYANRYEKSRPLSDLRRWYTVPIVEKDAGDAISDCQRQNAEWTKNLAQRYLALEIVATVIVIAIVSVLLCISGVDTVSWLYLIVPVKWCYTIIMRARKTARSANEVSSAISDYDLTSITNIENAQARIYQYRKDRVLIPDWFYRLCKGRDNELTA